MADDFFKRLLVVMLSSALAGCNSGDTASKKGATGLQAGLSVILSNTAITVPVTVRFFLTNGTDEALTLLPWGSPLEAPLTADSFDVMYNGQRLEYQGIVVKRMAPVDADYITVAAGQTVEAVVNLSNAYAMSAAGDYTVQLRTIDGAFHIGTVEMELATPVLNIVRTAE